MERIKVSDNFYLDEFCSETQYKRMISKGADPRRLVNPKRIDIAQFIRTYLGVCITICNWWTGGVYINSGTRDPLHPYGAVDGDHTRGDADDLKFKGMTSNEAWERFTSTTYV